MAGPVAADTHHGTQSSSVSNCLGTTPPDRREVLLTPPDSAERSQQPTDLNALIRQLRRYADRSRSSADEHHVSWKEVKITQEQYHLIREPELDQLFRRYDYDSVHQVLIVRMPSAVHDIVAACFSRAIQNKLDSIARDDGVAPAFASLAANIQAEATSDIFLFTRDDASPHHDMQRSPDAQFRHKLAAYPGIVIEVSYSQSGKKVDRIAQDYILYSNGHIKIVIGVDINHKSNEATLSVWRPQYTWSEEDQITVLEARRHMSQLFRSADGLAINESACLDVSLSDFTTDELFAPAQARARAHEQPVLSLPFKAIFDLLVEAEDIGRARKIAQRAANERTVFLKRRRTSSPEERLHSDDEARFAGLERKAAEAANKDDEYEPDSKPKSAKKPRS